jgi:SAM-dependent methyltransferase
MDTKPSPMTLRDLLNRKTPPDPWAEGENIPWDEPAFSRRMLREHLAQNHDHASRRSETIDRQVHWIQRDVLDGRPTRVLDLACGPGLYTSRLASLGHECVGIDFAPAAVTHARTTAERNALACDYRLADLRDADFGDGFGLAMMLFGQLNVFRRRDARAILAKALRALAPGGRLLLEPQRFAAVEKAGRAPAAWHAHASGLFSDRPHLCLTENFWDAASRTATERFFIVDADTAAVTRHAMSTVAYTDDEYRDMLTDLGFADVRLFPSLTGVEVDDPSQSANLALLARAP